MIPPKLSPVATLSPSVIITKLRGMDRNTFIDELTYYAGGPPLLLDWVKTLTKAGL